MPPQDITTTVSLTVWELDDEQDMTACAKAVLKPGIQATVHGYYAGEAEMWALEIDAGDPRNVIRAVLGMKIIQQGNTIEPMTPEAWAVDERNPERENNG